MNKCILVGRLSSDPELRSTQSGVSVCRFTIAVQRRFKESDGERKADFLNCIAWRQSAEYVSRYAGKGTLVEAVGSIQNRSYDAQDGSKRYVTEIIVDEVKAYGNAQSGAGNTDDAVQRAQEVFGADMVEVEEEPLPF